MKVLLAVDDYHKDSRSITMAKQYLEHFEDIQVTVLYVSSEPVSSYYRTPVGLYHHLTEEQLNRVNELKDSVMHEFWAWHGKVHFRMESGNPVKVICAVAEDENADLVIIGKPHRHFIVSSSVADGVLHNASRSVLVAQ